MHLFVGGVSAPANGPDGRMVTGSWTLIKVTSTLAVRLVASLLFEVYQIKSNQIKSNQIKSNQIKSNQIKSNQIKPNQTKPNQTKSNFISQKYNKQKEKYCYVVVIWHILCRLPVTPKHKFRNDIYTYTYIYLSTYTHLQVNGLGEFKKCVKIYENPNSVSFLMKTISCTLHIWDLSNVLG